MSAAVEVADTAAAAEEDMLVVEAAVDTEEVGAAEAAAIARMAD